MISYFNDTSVSATKRNRNLAGFINLDKKV